MERVGLVGFGRIAELAHLPAWLTMPGVDVGAIAAHCAERLAYIADHLPRLRVYGLREEMLAEETIGCLDICTPPHDHTPTVPAAGARRVPRLCCEKRLTAAE